MVMQARYESVLKTLCFSTGIALQRSLQEVTSQDDSFMPDISGYIWERVKRDRPMFKSTGFRTLDHSSCWYC